MYNKKTGERVGFTITEPFEEHIKQGTTLLAWYLTNLPSYIEKYENNENYIESVKEAKIILKTMKQFAGMTNIDDYLVQSLNQI